MQSQQWSNFTHKFLTYLSGYYFKQVPKKKKNSLLILERNL